MKKIWKTINNILGRKKNALIQPQFKNSHNNNNNKLHLYRAFSKGYKVTRFMEKTVLIRSWLQMILMTFLLTLVQNLPLK